MLTMFALLDWMEWTSATAVFVAAVFVALAAITALAIFFPSSSRKGFLPFETARGDRIYVSLLGTGLVMVLFVVITDMALPIGVAIALLVWVGPVMKWG